MAHRDRWTHADELLALILEKLDSLEITTAWIWTDPKKRPRRRPAAFRYPRPGRLKPKAKTSPLSAISAFFAK